MCAHIPWRSPINSKSWYWVSGGKNPRRSFYKSLIRNSLFPVFNIQRMAFVWEDILPLFIKRSTEPCIHHLPRPAIVSCPRIESVICSFFIVFSLYERRTMWLLDSFVSLHGKLGSLPLACFWHFINSGPSNERERRVPKGLAKLHLLLSLPPFNIRCGGAGNLPWLKPKIF